MKINSVDVFLLIEWRHCDWITFCTGIYFVSCKTRMPVSAIYFYQWRWLIFSAPFPKSKLGPPRTFSSTAKPFLVSSTIAIVFPEAAFNIWRKTRRANKSVPINNCNVSIDWIPNFFFRCLCVHSLQQQKTSTVKWRYTTFIFLIV